MIPKTLANLTAAIATVTEILSPLSDQVTKISILCHEVNRLHDHLIASPTPSNTWSMTPENIKASARVGVQSHLADPGKTPEQSHQEWLSYKEAEGWVYGPVKDIEKKEHPCMVPYDQLPADMKTKDYLFKASVSLGATLFQNVSA